MDRDFPGRYLDFFKQSCLVGHHLALPLSHQNIGGTCCRWGPAEIDVLSHGKRQWRTAGFSIMIVLEFSLQRFHSVFRVLVHCPNKV